jgi:hypothetical protein
MYIYNQANQKMGHTMTDYAKIFNNSSIKTKLAFLKEAIDHPERVPADLLPVLRDAAKNTNKEEGAVPDNQPI